MQLIQTTNALIVHAIFCWHKFLYFKFSASAEKGVYAFKLI